MTAVRKSTERLTMDSMRPTLIVKDLELISKSPWSVIFGSQDEASGNHLYIDGL